MVKIMKVLSEGQTALLTPPLAKDDLDVEPSAVAAGWAGAIDC
jgi:hypothetical protein